MLRIGLVQQAPKAIDDWLFLLARLDLGLRLPGTIRWAQSTAYRILRPYVFSPDRPPTRLLFPRFSEGGEAMVTDFRKVLNRVTVPAGWEAGAITSKMFRHTYCSARLATLDCGAPVSPDTVSREMGHSSRDLVEQVYGHLGRTPRHRGEAVEYRVEQHAATLGDRLPALCRRFEGLSGTTADTGAVQVT